jgi:DNA-binding XRE family transcriptional regulator
MRERACLTQKAAGDKVGLGQSTIAAIETGRRPPSLEEVLALLDVYGGRLVDLDVRQADPARARVRRVRGRPRIPTEFYYDSGTNVRILRLEADSRLAQARRLIALERFNGAYALSGQAVALAIRWHAARLGARAPRVPEGFVTFAGSTGLPIDRGTLELAEALLEPTVSEERAMRPLQAIAENLLGC